MAQQIARTVEQAIQWATNTGALRGIGLMPVIEDNKIVGVRKASFWEGLLVRLFSSSTEKEQTLHACSQGLLALRERQRTSDATQYRISQSSVSESSDPLFEGKNLQELFKRGFLKAGTISSQVELEPDGNQSRYEYTPITAPAFRLAVPLEKGSALAKRHEWSVKAGVVTEPGSFTYIPDNPFQRAPTQFPKVFDHIEHHFNASGELQCTTHTDYVLQNRTPAQISQGVASYVEDGTRNIRTISLEGLKTMPTNLIHEDVHGNLTIWQLRKDATQDTIAWYTAKCDTHGKPLSSQVTVNGHLLDLATDRLNWSRCPCPLVAISSKQAKVLHFADDVKTEDGLGRYHDVYNARLIKALEMSQAELAEALEEVSQIEAVETTEATDGDDGAGPDRVSELNHAIPSLTEVSKEIETVLANRIRAGADRDVVYPHTGFSRPVEDNDFPHVCPNATVEAVVRKVELESDELTQIDWTDHEAVSAMYERQYSLQNMADDLDNQRRQLFENDGTPAQWEALRQLCKADSVADIGVDQSGNLLPMSVRHHHYYRLSMIDNAIKRVNYAVRRSNETHVEPILDRIREIAATPGIYDPKDINNDIQALEKERLTFITKLDNQILDLYRSQTSILALNNLLEEAMQECPFKLGKVADDYPHFTRADDYFDQMNETSIHYLDTLEILNAAHLRDTRIEFMIPVRKSRVEDSDDVSFNVDEPDGNSTVQDQEEDLLASIASTLETKDHDVAVLLRGQKNPPSLTPLAVTSPPNSLLQS